MPVALKRFSAVAVLLFLNSSLSGSIGAQSASDSGEESVRSTVYEMEVGLQSTAANDFSNIVVIRPSAPGTYEVSLRTNGFEPYLVVYRGENVIGYHVPAIGADRAELSLVLEEGLFSGSGGVVFTLVAASRDPSQGGPVILQITPDVKLLSPQAAFGEVFLTSFGQAFDNLLTEARANDAGSEFTFVEVSYGAGMQMPADQTQTYQSYSWEYSEPMAMASESATDKYLGTQDDVTLRDTVEATDGGEAVMTAPGTPAPSTESPVAMVPSSPAATAPAPEPPAVPPSGMSGLISGIIAAIEPASDGVMRPLSGGVDVAADIPDAGMPTSGDDSGPGPASENDTSSENSGRQPASVVAANETRPLWRDFLLPDFKPWPPPKPTASLVVPQALYTPFLDTDTANYGDVSGLIENALGIGGYERFAYFGVPGGFALVTQLEQIQANGEPVQPASARWNAAIAGPRPFDLATYIHRLFFARVGYYRVLVFTVLGEPITLGGETLAEDPDWIGEGATGLPTVLKQERFTDDHNITVLVYEFERHEVDPEPKFRDDDDSPLLASDHLKGAKFSSYFTGDGQ